MPAERNRAVAMQRDRSDWLDRALVAALLLAAIVGAYARFAQLDRPLFWQDETATALRVTGHGDADLDAMFDGRTVHGSDLLALTRGPGSPFAAATALARAEPHRTPLFFALEAAWIDVAGTSVDGYRTLSVVFGIAGILFAYGLATTLTGSRRGGAIAAMLFTTSPLFVLYARQAREYALFADATLAATWAMLVAWRAPSVRTWSLYGFAALVGLYADPLFALVIVAHGVATVALHRRQLALAGAWLASAAVAAALVVPWLLFATKVAAGTSILDQLSWAKTPYPLSYQALKWGFNLGALVFDGAYASRTLAPIGILVALVVLVAFAYVVRFGTLESRALLGCLAVVPALGLQMLDLVQHAHFATIPRYMFATWTGLEMALAVAVADLIERVRWRPVAFGTLGVAVALGLFAAMLRNHAETWWDDADSLPYRAIAHAIASTNPATVLSEDRGRGLLVLSRYVPEETTFVLCADGRLPARPPLATGDFVFAPSPALLHAVQAKHHLANVAPADRSSMAAFKNDLHRDVKATASSDPTTDPANALWQISR